MNRLASPVSFANASADALLRIAERAAVRVGWCSPIVARLICSADDIAAGVTMPILTPPPSPDPVSGWPTSPAFAALARSLLAEQRPADEHTTALLGEFAFVMHAAMSTYAADLESLETFTRRHFAEWWGQGPAVLRSLD